MHVILVPRGTTLAWENAQELVTIGGVQLGSRLDTGKWADTADEMGERLWDTTKNSLLTFALTNAPAAGHNIHVHMRAKIASDGYTKLYAGIMPSDAELRAMGISESEALGALAVFEMQKQEAADAANNFNATYEAAAEQLVGIQIDAGIQVKAISTHVVDRMNERNISAVFITDALVNPLKRGLLREDGSQQFIGEKATVVINMNTGKIITVWATKSKLVEKLRGERMK